MVALKPTKQPKTRFLTHVLNTTSYWESIPNARSKVKARSFPIMIWSVSSFASTHILSPDLSSFPMRGLMRTATLTEQAFASPVSAKKPFGFGLLPTYSSSCWGGCCCSLCATVISWSTSIRSIEFKLERIGESEFTLTVIRCCFCHDMVESWILVWARNHAVICFWFFFHFVLFLPIRVCCFAYLFKLFAKIKKLITSIPYFQISV